jgi:hypothetical protein
MSVPVCSIYEDKNDNSTNSAGRHNVFNKRTRLLEAFLAHFPTKPTYHNPS